jgi:cell wall-associated NlpC family hydrolase
MRETCMRDEGHPASTVRRLAAAASLAVLAAVVLAVSVGTSPPSSAASPASGAAIVSAAASQNGVPYCEGGGGIDGPTVGTASSTCAPGVKGYDCMSLAQYAVFQVTGITVPIDGSLPGPGTFIPPNGTVGLEPGDVMFFGGPSLDDYSHSGIYAGNGMLYDALAPGDVVQEHPFATVNSDYGNVYRGAVRYVADTSTTTSTTLATVPHPVFGIRTKSLGAGTVSTRAHPTTYAQKLKAFGGKSPYRWSVVKGSGSLPPGLHLNSGTGMITGHFTKAGRFTFKVAVADARTRTTAAHQHVAKETLSITIRRAR